MNGEEKFAIFLVCVGVIAGMLWMGLFITSVKAQEEKSHQSCSTLDIKCDGP